MFAGFNLMTKKSYEEYYYYGKSIFNKFKKDVRDKLNEYVGINGSLDGSKLQEEWFPQVKADIFISHSHDDERLAIGLAGWLHKEFGLYSFIDSCIWNYANDLLWEIDNKYCTNESDSNFNYEKRNFSTSHVHMMLSTALTKMMDRTECIIFLNTPNSTVTTKETVINKTYSPWIYSEIITAKLIRKRELSPDRLNKLKKSILISEKYAKDSLSVEYILDLRDMHPINDMHLNKLYNIQLNNSGTEALDNLYDIAGVEI